MHNASSYLSHDTGQVIGDRRHLDLVFEGILNSYIFGYLDRNFHTQS